MTAPNVQVTSLGANAGDGLQLLPSGFQRTNPMQGVLQAMPLCSTVNNNANVGALAAVAANTCANQTVTVLGIAANDIMLAVSKPNAQAGLGIVGMRYASANTIDVQFLNNTTASITPTANEAYSFTVFRGMNPMTSNLSPAAVPAQTVMEQQFNITPTLATATAYVANGGVVNVNVTYGGMGYNVNPTIALTGGGGIGATAQSVISPMNGIVTGIKITNPGSGYTSPPVVNIIGGGYLAPGMMVTVAKNAYQANLGIAGCRITGLNMIGITFVNTSNAAITPTANESYSIIGINAMPGLSAVLTITATLANLSAAAANTSNQTAVTIPGIQASDIFLAVNPSALQSPLVFGGGYCAANTVNFQYGGGVPGGTPSNGTYTLAVCKPNVPATLSVGTAYFTPASVLPNTTAEQVFTLPANMTVTANSSLIINKPSFTPGIGLVGARANSTTTIGITFVNMTGAAIIPPAETYSVADFNSFAPTITANQTAGYSSQICSMSFDQNMDLTNEIQQNLVLSGLIKGG